MLFGLSADTWASVAVAVITAAASVFATVLSYRSTRHRGRDIFGRRNVSETRDPVRLVYVDVPAAIYEHPRRKPWLVRLGILFVISALGLIPFGFSMYQFVASGFHQWAWWVVGLMFGAPGAVALGLLIAMLQIGRDRAGVHSQMVQVEGHLRLVVERATEALSRMAIGVRKHAVTEDTATIDASRLGRPENISIRIEQIDDGKCEVEVRAESQPKIFSFRRNSRHVTRFITELTGVVVYPASFVPENTGRRRLSTSQRGGWQRGHQ